MLIPPGVRIYLATQPVSLLKSIDGLAAEVQQRFGLDPLHGHLFLFFNRRRNGAKILWWDHGGFVLLYKRLEKGRFQIPEPSSEPALLTHAQLSALLEGIDLKNTRRIRLWNPENYT